MSTNKNLTQTDLSNIALLIESLDELDADTSLTNLSVDQVLVSPDWASEGESLLLERDSNGEWSLHGDGFWTVRLAK